MLMGPEIGAALTPLEQLGVDASSTLPISCGG
jgi:hypothetical protein